jgi:hypothetical protein
MAPGANSTPGNFSSERLSLRGRTKALTVCPSDDNCSATHEPKKPDPPVKNTFMRAGYTASGQVDGCEVRRTGAKLRNLS